MSELPAADIDRVDFHRPEDGPSADLLLEVSTAKGGYWVGAFRRPRTIVHNAATGAFATPHPSRVCVIVSGDAVLIDVDTPTAYRWLDTDGPVVSVREQPSDDLLLLASPWAITAIDVDGVRWTTKRLAIEGLRIDESADGLLAGVADPDDVEPRDFAVDLRTGRVVGGVPFE